ncbi:ribosome-binding factor A [Actinopolymorpha cephalotaxi]|uniref:Ribosome-binding factor A n=1 Tax=Actinopolymorpha cephalotaxi TaxID=504797 RepID=A0A1I2RCS6_9ACTN|nr:ribosome-binding factor A [Actinopolymorpha cephalotaxi]SFG37279.1 ribosome-binding factor A [Actinopolymorpha cephalotaxi]
MNQTRVNQLADRIQVIVAEMLERRVKDPRLGFVTVTEARLTGDLREATVFYTVLGGDQDHTGTAVALESAKGLIRSEVGRRLGLRHTPSLAFVPDAVPENAQHIEDLLRLARDSDAEVARRAAQASPAGEADPYRVPRTDEDLDDLDELDAPGDEDGSDGSDGSKGGDNRSGPGGHGGS